MRKGRIRCVSRPSRVEEACGPDPFLLYEYRRHVAAYDALPDYVRAHIRDDGNEFDPIYVLEEYRRYEQVYDDAAKLRKATIKMLDEITQAAHEYHEKVMARAWEGLKDAKFR